MGRDPLATQICRQLLEQGMVKSLSFDLFEGALKAHEAHFTDCDTPIEIIQRRSNEPDRYQRQDNSDQPGEARDQAPLPHCNQSNGCPGNEPRRQSRPGDVSEIGPSFGPRDELPWIGLFFRGQLTFNEELLPEVDQRGELGNRSLALLRQVRRRAGGEPLRQNRFTQTGCCFIDELKQRALAEDVQIFAVEMVDLPKLIAPLAKLMPLARQSSDAPLIQSRPEACTLLAAKDSIVQDNERDVNCDASYHRVPDRFRQLAKERKHPKNRGSGECDAAKVGQNRGALIQLFRLAKG